MSADLPLVAISESESGDYSRAILNVLDDLTLERSWLHDMYEAILNVLDDAQMTTENLRASETRLAGRTVELEAANQELEAFSYTVSHDLRGPLRALDGFSRIIIEEHASQVPAEVLRFLGLVRESAREMAQLVDDLLEFSRLGRQEMLKQQVDLNDVVKSALNGLAREREGRTVDVTVQDLPWCEADPVLVRQVYTNLISNALKFTRDSEAAHVDVGCSVREGVPVFFVRDNGIGFAPQYAEKIFAVFQRLHRSEEYEGTGVGLAIVRRIVERHGGRVWAESGEDQGATFCFTLQRGAEDGQQVD